MHQILLLCILVSEVVGLDNGLGLTPQMGWNSWNHFHCDVDADLIKATADAIVSKGLDKWYKYVNIDDCWARERDANGNIVPDESDFPDMAALASYVHGKGLLFGLYSDAGNKTCAGRPGSLGYETQDANTYAQWGVDYLKYDNCNNNNVKPEVRYPVMRDALNKTNRPIFFSMCEWGQDDPAKWAPAVGNSWRTTGDIGDNWNSMISRADQNDQWWSYAGPGGWNDPDMLEIGNGGMTITEYTTHFSLWALMKAPLLIGCDVRSMSDDTLKILTNEDVIKISQDKLGKQGHKVNTTGTNEVWAGPLANGDIAVILLNRGSTRSSITAQWSDIGAEASAKGNVTDLWTKKNLGVMTGSVTAAVESHGVAMYRISFQNN